MLGALQPVPGPSPRGRALGGAESQKRRASSEPRGARDLDTRKMISYSPYTHRQYTLYWGRRVWNIFRIAARPKATSSQ